MSIPVPSFDLSADMLDSLDDRSEAVSFADGLSTALRTAEIDRVIADHDIPGTGGIQLLEPVRADSSNGLPLDSHTPTSVRERQRRR